MTECGVLPFRVSHKTLLSVLDSLSRMHFREYELHLIGGFSLALTGVREYRTADCIEFGCTNPDAFREFCNDIRESGIVNLFESGKALKLVKRDRPVIFDRGYSCRLFFYAPLQESDKKIPVKCEVMREVRIAFDPSGRTIFGFPALSVDDCFALNLMGNADRRQDSPPMFRDVLDIFALLDAEGLERMPERALYKANKERRGETLHLGIAPVGGQPAFRRRLQRTAYRNRRCIGAGKTAAAADATLRDRTGRMS